jgi:hypothetical protein
LENVAVRFTDPPSEKLAVVLDWRMYPSLSMEICTVEPV